MAEKRMFYIKLIESDAFTDMPLSTQALYFHLNLAADDDGFVANPKKIKRSIGATDDDLRILITKNYVIPFESGIIVITHWRLNNYLRKDRYKPSINSERNSIKVLPDGRYTVDSDLGIPLVDQRYTQYSNSIGKNSIGYDDDGADIIHNIRERIEYNNLCSMLSPIELELVHVVVADMVDVYTTMDPAITINRNETYPAERVRALYDTIDHSTMLHVVDRLKRANVGTNAAAYVRTVVYNAIKARDVQDISDARPGPPL